MKKNQLAYLKHTTYKSYVELVKGLLLKILYFNVSNKLFTQVTLSVIFPESDSRSSRSLLSVYSLFSKERKKDQDHKGLII